MKKILRFQFLIIFPYKICFHIRIFNKVNALFESSENKCFFNKIPTQS